MTSQKLISALLTIFLLGQTLVLEAQGGRTKRLIDEVNPFIGTSNYGTTNPGAVLPNGLMSVTPFNVMGNEDLNKFDKDKRWWSTPYSFDNKFFTGFSHVNLSGVGCPELGSILLSASSGKLDVDYHHYGTTLSKEEAHPNYYTAYLDKHKVKSEVTATLRTALARFSFDEAGEKHILLNLGQGLTNETGATVRFVNDSTLVGSKLMGTFCYNPQAVFNQYFAIRLSKKPQSSTYWKKQPKMTGVEAEWDPDDGNYKLYPHYKRELSGDNIGVAFNYNIKAGEIIYVQTAVSFVSVENALDNLAQEQGEVYDFEKIKLAGEEQWEDALSRIVVEGGTQEERTIFYTALYHLLLHPNILQDCNGEYPSMASLKTMKTEGDRYTVYSLWDTYRNVHPLLSLVYPEKQSQMVKTMLQMYEESSWLPKWELYGQETLTMSGDPAITVINDSWQRGVRDFDTDLALRAMLRGAKTMGKDNLLRPEIDDYVTKGYIPLRQKFDHSVSNALEYYVADYNLARFAESLGKKSLAQEFDKRTKGYKHYYDKETGLLRPKLENGLFLSPFNPSLGKNFEPSSGFHEGNSWNYSFFIPYDIKGLAQLMGGKDRFCEKLYAVFKEENYDPANEPDIAYPYLFTYFPKWAYRTQELTKSLREKYYKNEPSGIPGNDDTGTMSAWLIYTMLGFYPDCPGEMSYALTTPTFPRVTIKLNPKYYKERSLVIERRGEERGAYFRSIRYGSTYAINKYRLSHSELVNAKNVIFYTRSEF